MSFLWKKSNYQANFKSKYFAKKSESKLIKEDKIVIHNWKFESLRVIILADDDEEEDGEDDEELLVDMDDACLPNLTFFLLTTIDNLHGK